jgi:hypothetical protein
VITDTRHAHSKPAAVNTVPVTQTTLEDAPRGPLPRTNGNRIRNCEIPIAGNASVRVTLTITGWHGHNRRTPA